MPLIGTVTGQEIKKNRDGSIAVRLLQVQISNESDIQTVQYMGPAGEDSAPINGDKVQIFRIGPAFQFAVAVEDQNNEASAPPGGKRLFSRDADTGAVMAFIDLLVGGNLQLNGSARSAVGYEDLLTEFNELKSAFNSHNHVYVPGTGTPTPTDTALPQSAADITTAEVPTVKLP